MKQQPQPKLKMKRPKDAFRKTANGFILNGREVVVEYKTKRRQGTTGPLPSPTAV